MNPAQDNPLKNRLDVIRACVQLLTPLVPRMEKGHASVVLGASSAVYPDQIAGMEAYSRALWGIVPMLAGGCREAEAFWKIWREGLQHGVDPESPEYWGDLHPFDQRMVEMAVMGVAMCLVPERFLGDLTRYARENLRRWLSQINMHEMPTNNWVFFRILVNVGFLTNGLPYDAQRLREDLARVEEHYEGNGWYFDYPDQRDYYTSWGYHFYGLIYARAMNTHDPARCRRFLARAREFAPSFAAWFTADGQGLPYGRSLTYRFAQSSFFAAMGVAEVTAEGIDWGVMKGFFLRNMRFWLNKPIFTGDGLLSIGYGYPNLIMSEGYNAPGSPYWAMKAFICLALPIEHPFWTADESPYTPPRKCVQPSARLMIVRDEENAHVQAFSAGNHAPGIELSDAKYEKFAYSTAFAFSVPRSNRSLQQGAFDSTLAVTGDGLFWRTRFGSESFGMEEDRVVSVWKPYPDVTIRTTIRPMGDWHLRTHVIQTPRPLTCAEGGYAIQQEQGKHRAVTQMTVEAPRILLNVKDEEAPPKGWDAITVAAFAPWGISGLIGFRGYIAGEVLEPAPNTNLLWPRTLIPMLRADVMPGETRLMCAVLGTVTNGDQKWTSPPRKEEFDADMA